MTSDAWVILIQTRWHEDDLVGRLTDPMNPYYDPEEAKLWEVIDLPALAFEDGTPDPLGRRPGEALWPERFPVPFLKAQQRLDPRGFQALYQGRPSAGQGSFFRVEWLNTYKPDELPKNLRIYVASDHALSANQARDKTALVPVGVDDRDNIYILPDVWWKQGPADEVTEAMLHLMRTRSPVFWWAERGHISKSLGPFLRKRMQEEKVYTAIIEVTPTADKQTRAQSIQGRMAMGKVFFPAFATWWPEARDQLLKFPNSAHDDFVDALAYIGLGIGHTLTATGPAYQSPTLRGSFREMFNQIRARESLNRRRANASGW
jgi:predicted phage terminase large subunit-like protein